MFHDPRRTRQWPRCRSTQAASHRDAQRSVHREALGHRTWLTAADPPRGPAAARRGEAVRAKRAASVPSAVAPADAKPPEGASAPLLTPPIALRTHLCGDCPHHGRSLDSANDQGTQLPCPPTPYGRASWLVDNVPCLANRGCRLGVSVRMGGPGCDFRTAAARSASAGSLPPQIAVEERRLLAG